MPTRAGQDPDLALDATTPPAPDGHAGAEGAGPPDGFAMPGFDAMARLAARSLDVPLVALILRGGGAYWFTTQAGCLTQALQPLHPLYLDAADRANPQFVADTRTDPRFHNAALDPAPAPTPIRFFASEPVFTLAGQHMGALCVMDHRPRPDLGERERAALRDAAALAGAGVVLRSVLCRTDPVTQLPHRSAFFEDLRARLHDGAERAWLIAVEVAPVERFNAFVRAMGHAYSDDLLRAVATRIQAWMPAGTHLYQVGAARFAAVLPEAPARIDTDQLDDLVARLRQPFDCRNIPLTLQPGVGLLDLDIGELNGGDPLRLVMSASHEALNSVRGWAIYDQRQDERHRQDFFLVTELAAALTERAELDLNYQPRVSLDTGRCVGVEALARWHHPTLGPIPPSTFIRLAERAGLMRSLTEWVLDHSVAQLAAWQRDGVDLKLSLNVSSTDLGADLVTRLQKVADRHGVAPGALELEFTESTLMEHSDITRRYLGAIRQLGTGIAIDDFGTGYSNLAALRQMPATSLKIDQSFVRSMDASRHDAAIVRSVADLARDFGFRVVVEGVETQRIYDAVLDMACDEVQGFHVSRPLPASNVVGWLRHHAELPARHR